jgi:Tfp pilus assembly protein PilO
MNKFGKNKRNKLAVVGLLTAAILAGLWFGLIRVQMQSLDRLATQQTEARRKLEMATKVIKSGPEVETRLSEVSQRLSTLETGMASGDLYSWAINTVRQFKLPYKVEIPQFSQIDGPKEMGMFSQFPYKQATISIAGSAQFYDFGRFLADFENQFPYMRVMNVSLEPVGSGNPADREKLAFKMDIVTLVKPATS